MEIDPSVDRHLYRIFTESFAARDIAQAIVSFDASSPAAEVQQNVIRQRLRLVGIREAGIVTGYAATSELDDGSCGDHMRTISPEEIVEEWDPLTKVIPMLAEREQLFVRGLGRIGGILTRTDLQKPPVRMWLFGMITIIEMSFQRMIEERFPGSDWQAHISSGRLQKAADLLEQRTLRSQELELLDCLQFSSTLR